MTRDALPQLCALIRRFEGLRLRAYLCPAGVPTIGYGATGPDVQLGITWSHGQAEMRLRADAEHYLGGTHILCPDLRGPQIAAIADFAYNLGLGRLRASTLRLRINAGDLDGARVELAKWVRGGGRVLPGLVARRAAESALLDGLLPT